MIAIVEELGDMSLVARDRARHRVLLAHHHLAQVLRIELTRQLGGADQIAEHHGQLAALDLLLAEGGWRLLADRCESV